MTTTDEAVTEAEVLLEIFREVRSLRRWFVGAVVVLPVVSAVVGALT